MFAGCGAKYEARNGNLDTYKDVVITVAGAWTDFKALDVIGQEFSKVFPNCTVEYEYLQNYVDTSVKRLGSQGDNIDLFMTDNIQEDSPYIPYALELTGQSDKLDLSQTFEGMIKNFTISGSNELYAVPIGSKVRGMFVNKTLLDKFGISMPTNKDELLAAAKTLADEGYIPFHGNPGLFAQQLAYPAVANVIAHAEDYEATYDMVNSCDEEAAELFREPLEFLYTIMENKYYNYKYVENELNMFVNTDDHYLATDFLGIKDDGNGNATVDEVGTVAFMPAAASLQTVMATTKEDYHSNVEYEFVLAPITDEGGVAYLSPGKGIAVNKNSDDLDWALEFMNFFFTEQYNKEFAEASNLLPNTSDAVEYAAEAFGVPKEQICELGEVTFDYGFYGMIVVPMTDIVKGNNPKYMKDDGKGNLSLYDFEHYMDLLKSAFATQRGAN